MLNDRRRSPAVARGQEGDREAMRFLYLRYADNVYGYVRSIVRDEYEAEDVTQHVFAKLMTVLGSTRSATCRSGLDPPGRAQRRGRPHAHRRATPAEEVRRRERADDTARDRSHCLRDALAALPEEQRRCSCCATSSASPPARSPRPRPHRALDPRPASPRPRRAARRADRDGVRSATAAEGGGVSAAHPCPRPRRSVPSPASTRPTPSCSRSCCEVVGPSPRKGAFTIGAELEAFEAEFATYCGTDDAVGVSSGTEAIACRLRALDIGPGDEVIVPTNSFIATAEAVSSAGATPSSSTSTRSTHLITAEAVERAIGPRAAP